MSLFRNHLLAEVGKATLNIVEEANRSGDFDRLYQQLQELDKKKIVLLLNEKCVAKNASADHAKIGYLIYP